MKRNIEKSSIIDTKEELIKNFSKEQMEIYNYYLNKFSKDDAKKYPAVIEDREIRFLENGCKILEKVLKVEVVVALLVGTFIFMIGGMPEKADTTVKYDEISVVEYQLKN